MNATDYLLHWLSERGQATQQQMNDACKALRQRFQQSNGPISRLLRDGHIERLSDRMCCVIPPTMLIVGKDEGHWYGARTPGLRCKLEVFSIVIDVVPQKFGPELWRLRADADRIQEVAQKHDIAVLPERGLELLRALPALQTVLMPQADGIGVFTMGKWQVFRVNNAGRWFWEDCNDLSKPGLYREVEKHPTTYAWHEGDGQEYQLQDDVQRVAAKWRVVGDRATLSHDAAKQTLTIWPKLELPVLVERALHTASGQDVEFTDSGKVYINIGTERAKQVARILDLPLTR